VLLAWLSTLYPPKVEIRDPEFAAEFSQFSMIEGDDDGYPFQHQRAKIPVGGYAGDSPADDSAPVEEVDSAQWISTLQIAKRLTLLLERIDVQQRGRLVGDFEIIQWTSGVDGDSD
jgi:hypothetical protein